MTAPTLVAFLAAALALAVAGLSWRLRVLSRDHQGQRQRLASANQSLEFLQNSFSKFAPAAIVDELASKGASTHTERKVVTVLFADVQGFTKMSEKLDPDVLVQILNGYFKSMSRAITHNRGHVSKFIGDGILALFGAVEPNPWQANDAVHAALAMREALAEYNRELASQGLPQLRIGVGIHRGDVVAGVIGSDHLREFTVIGANVNLASRIESMTRAHQVDILVTEAVRQELDPRFELAAMPPTAAKGVSEPVTTFAVRRFDLQAAGSAQPAVQA